MSETHHYQTHLTWTGNLGQGTQSYQGYSRNHEVHFAGKAAIAGSSDPQFRGDPSRHNPEELLVASLSACHMLWYLHLCAVNHITVESYEDQAAGSMVTNASPQQPEGSGQFTKVLLQPKVVISSGDPELALQLHAEANRRCFIANSMNFPVAHQPSVTSQLS